MARKPTKKQLLTAEGVAQGKSLHRAALDAGYSPHTAKSMPYKPQENARILEAVEKRKAEAMRRAQIHTDIIIGGLAEIATSSIGDVLDDQGNFSLERARENGVDHLIKKIEYTKDGVKFEMYSRTEAMGQLRDTFGMKQEPRPNAQTEVESAIQDFIRKADERGYQLTYDEARQFIEPRMANNLTH